MFVKVVDAEAATLGSSSKGASRHAGTDQARSNHMNGDEMATRRQHRILIATDGSPPAQAALETTLVFPWPSSSHGRAVVARSSALFASEETRSVVEESFKMTAFEAGNALTRRWPKSRVVVADGDPADAILAEAESFEASTVVLGWRGHGRFRRLLAGSVSRRVAEQASCPVLVVREAPAAVRRFVVGFDGCYNAERALDFLGSLEPGRGTRAILVNVVEPVTAPSIGRLPASIRTRILGELATMNEEKRRQGQTLVDAGVARLQRAGWKAEGEIRPGAPLASLLKAVAEHRGDVLVVGARAVSGLERALLGSVAAGALNNSPVVLLVR